jgi:hypothetical protein
LTTSARRLALAGAVATLSAAATLGALPSAQAAGGSAVTGGYTYLVPTKATAAAMASKHIVLSAIAPASFQAETGQKTLALPITGGTATPPNYVTRLGGGIRLKLKAHAVSLTKIVFNTRSHTGSALVGGKRVAVFTLGDPNSGNGGPGAVSFGGYKVALSKAGVKAVDARLHTTFFTHHKVLATGTTSVTFH